MARKSTNSSGYSLFSVSRSVESWADLQDGPKKRIPSVIFGITSVI